MRERAAHLGDQAGRQPQERRYPGIDHRHDQDVALPDFLRVLGPEEQPRRTFRVPGADGKPPIRRGLGEPCGRARHIRHGKSFVPRPLRPASADQTFPVLPVIQHQEPHLIRRQKKHIVRGRQRSTSHEVLSDEEHQPADGGGEIHQMMAIGLPQCEGPAEPPVQPAEDHPSQPARSEPATDLLEGALPGGFVPPEHLGWPRGCGSPHQLPDDAEQIVWPFAKAWSHHVRFAQRAMTEFVQVFVELPKEAGAGQPVPARVRSKRFVRKESPGAVIFPHEFGEVPQPEDLTGRDDVAQTLERGVQQRPPPISGPPRQEELQRPEPLGHAAHARQGHIGLVQPSSEPIQPGQQLGGCQGVRRTSWGHLCHTFHLGEPDGSAPGGSANPALHQQRRPQEFPPGQAWRGSLTLKRGPFPAHLLGDQGRVPPQLRHEGLEEGHVDEGTSLNDPNRA